MTLSEFYEYLLLGGSVECRLPQQRNALVQFIHNEYGFQIGRGTNEYITQHPDGTDYMVVELYNMPNATVVSLCVNALGRTIPFERVAPLMSSINMRLDDRTDEEFLEAFAELMS